MPAGFIDKQSVMILLALICLNAGISVAAPSAEDNKNGAAECDENGDCASDTMDCHKICGCDRSAYMAVYYNETTKSCVVSFKHLMISEINIYGQDQEESDGTPVDTMAEHIRIEAERIFNTILVSVLLFISCCVVCVISACLYCCRISYTDYRLKKDVKALAKKLQRDHKFRKTAKKPTHPAQESCNVVCEDAGVFVV